MIVIRQMSAQNLFQSNLKCYDLTLHYSILPQYPSLLQTKIVSHLRVQGNMIITVTPVTTKD